MRPEPRKKSAVEFRREQITAQVAHLRRQLSSKTRKDFTSDFRHEDWVRRSHSLIDELLGELSALDEPGEYDALPVAVVADEPGLRFDRIKQLIRLGEIESTGRRAHERVSRYELGRLAELGADGILQRAAQNAEAVFAGAVSQLRTGDIEAAEISYRRLKARQSCVGNHALATEVAIKLAMGMYEEAERAVDFILKEKAYERAVIGTHLEEFAREVCFRDERARAAISHVLKPLLEVSSTVVTKSRTADELQFTAIYISTVVIEGLEEFISPLRPIERRDDFYRVIRERIFSALYAEANSGTSLKSRMFALAVRQRLPHYWEPAGLLKKLMEG